MHWTGGQSAATWETVFTKLKAHDGPEY